MNLLFLGDSITDCDHCFTADNLGNGYVHMMQKLLQERYELSPVNIINGGTDGFTFPRIYRKWKTNWRGRSFDAVTVLAGINDTGALMDSGNRQQYEALLAICTEAVGSLLLGLSDSGCPNVFVLEPFLFCQPAYLLGWRDSLLDVRSAICHAVDQAAVHFKNIGSSCKVKYLPTQQLLDQAVSQYGLSSITTDGIHLTARGHLCLASYLSAQITAWCPK